MRKVGKQEGGLGISFSWIPAFLKNESLELAWCDE
jgi:hypothetical protein